MRFGGRSITGHGRALFAERNPKENYPRGRSRTSLALSSSRELAPAHCKEFFEFAAVEPDAAAVGTGIQNDRSIDAAINTQEFRPIARTFSPFSFDLVFDMAAAQ